MTRSTPEERLERVLRSQENEHLECKEAKNRFDFEELVKYCVALANERGGAMVLGVTDGVPRQVVGTHAFHDVERTKAGLIERLRLRVELTEIDHQDGRVLLIEVPSRPIGMPINYRGAYWMRGGEELVPMTADQLQRIFAEAGPDFSAEPCPGATLSDLSPEAIERFRAMWRRKSGNDAVMSLSVEQLLADAELISGGKVTVAAVGLFGTREAVSRLLPQAEVVFEYRSTEAAGPAQVRKEFREGFFLFDEALRELIGLRNDVQHFRDGLFVWDIPTFNESVIREAVLNAISHRDYRLAGSVFIRQYSRDLEIVSPGGLPVGVTTDNILWRQLPRNRRIAEALARCGFVERAGQGVNLMFEQCIKESKPKPDFAGTDDFQVSVTLQGTIQDPRFLRFLEKIGAERLASFSTTDLLVLDLVHRDQEVPEAFRSRVSVLQEKGLIEAVGAGRRRFILSKPFYGFLGEKGVYTRKRGLDHETNKALLLRHLEQNPEGSQVRVLRQVLPALSRDQIRGLLAQLKEEGRARSTGRTAAGRWFAGPESPKPIGAEDGNPAPLGSDDH